ncbi:MAG: PP2C family serine/threonine-protein phosphatase [Pirellulales bacterium]
MSRKQVPHLRVHRAEDDVELAAQSGNSEHSAVRRLLSAFAEATGWEVRATDPHVTQEHLTAAFGWPDSDLRKRVKLINSAPVDGLLDESDFFECTTTSEQSAWSLLESIHDMAARLRDCEAAVARQEAELAAGLSVTLPGDEAEDSLYQSIEEALQRAVIATGSDAAAVYLLDDSTSTLKMRACFGMPKSSLAKPPRMLRGALADLEALLGNAVLLENISVAPDWNSPEAYAAGLCVPIGSATMPHGTLWLWSDHIRDFSTVDIESAKDASDKILGDIERRVLSSEVLRVRSAVKQLDAAGFVQSSLLPDSQPLHADFDIGGFTTHADALGGSFHTWNITPQEQMIAAVGAAASQGVAGALVSARLHTVLDIYDGGKNNPSELLRRANDLMWGLDDADWRCSLGVVSINPANGAAQLACAGSIRAFIIGQRGYRLLSAHAPMLGLQPDSVFKSISLQLEPGDILMLAPESLLASEIQGGLTQETLLGLLLARHEEPLGELASEISQLLPLSDERRVLADQSLILVRRRF